ncbi:hypothetical protein FGO68_gene6718 [Halteria grandinella]|uniref:Coiled-coil domain-containing protein 86 n=1 Tax=Halteria grandinella TaxID=5974 RepID=A0A8J8NNI5_HALGN|nr:hypothetical protein FGO68_gene6718 [Halteria grandinella]
MVKKAKVTKEVPQLVEEEAIPSLVKDPTPATPQPVLQAAPQEPSTAKPFELGRKTPLGTSKAVGMPKSKKPWKVLSERSSKHKASAPRSWEKKMEEKRKLKAVRDRVREERDKRKEARKAIAVRLQERLKRKEINTMKSASYQIIKNSAKAKMGNKKAKKLITKLPAEIFYAKFK